jgi:ferric enterobactin receptor
MRNRFVSRAVLSVLFILLALSSSAQNEDRASGNISGRVVDSLTRKPVEYVAIGLWNQATNKVVNGTTTDSTGAFTLQDIADGKYKMQLEFIGYKKSELKITVSKEKPQVVLEELKLASKQTALNEVTVTGEKALIENKIDKLIYNADRDITSQSGVAADVLKKVPMVSVDVDGNVELQGNANIRFLINGKPSVIFGSNIADVLQSIPANQIQSIEVITSPGAKYDAEGTGGIINIILKKSSAQGVNGNISLSAGTRLENSSLNLNARKGKFGVNAFFSGNAQLVSTTLNSMNRTSQDSAGTSHLLQNGKSDFDRHGFETGIGFDWDITAKDNINGSLAYDYFGTDNTGSAKRTSVSRNVFGNLISDESDSIQTSNKFFEHAFDYEIGYKRKFKKEDQELELIYNASLGTNYNRYEETEKQISSEIISGSSHGNNPGIENETNIELNYTHPVAEDVTLETGAKTETIHVHSASDVYLLGGYGIYDFSSDQSSFLDFKRNVYAGYLSFNFALFDALKIQAGGRSEYTEAKANFSNVGNVNLTPYNTIVPSVVLSHKFKKERTLKFSYTRRIERPDYGDMNPFLNASDPKNITTGNPNLRPEIGDKAELSYSKSFVKGGNITTTLFLRNNTDDIQPYTRFYPQYKAGDSTYTNVSVRIRENIGYEHNYGLSVFASVPVSKKINLRANVNCFQRYIYTGISSVGNVEGFNYRTNLNATYQVDSTLTIELFGNLNSKRVNAQGTFPSFTTYNFALRKQLFHKKGSIALTATNFFDEYVNQETNLHGDNFTLLNTRQLPYRSFGINFTYKFGKLEFKKEKQEEDINLTNPPGNEK